MGCASSKQTKVVKFQEPDSKNNNNNPTTTVTPSSTKPASDATKTSTNDVTTKNNAATAEQPELTPIVELPKTQQQQQQQKEEPKKPTVNTDKDSKQQEYANSILAPIELPSGVEPSKDTNEAAAVKKEARPLSGGVLETRTTVIDATTSRIYSPTRMVSTAFASKTLTILHFNDVYNIEPREQEPVGGAARFVTKIKSFSESEAMVLFSGDLLNPSLSKYLC